MESLESRALLSADVLTYRNDINGTGLNAAETQLSPVNVKLGSFGKLSTTPLDGNVYAQPLVDNGTTISAGSNTTAGSAGVHNVVLVATEHDSVYAVDAQTGAVLWRRSFLDSTNPAGDVNNMLGATAISTLNGGDVNSGDLSEVGISATPVIDKTNGLVYVEVKTKEAVGSTTHFVQRLHALKIGDGTDAAAPYLIGDTVGTSTYTNNTPIYSYGTGAGSVTDPYNGTGKQVVAFNALRENDRGALNLVNGTLYADWASHGDNGPYHGWVVSWDVSHLSSSGFKLNGVLDVDPNGSEGGIWQAGGRLSFEANGGAFYAEVGNGPGGHGNPTLDANGFPTDADYYDALLKVVPDTTSTATSQNANGWGMKISDYFIPTNQVSLDNADRDFGSGAPLILPDSSGIAGHPHLIVAAGKEGKIYVIDRDNLGKFNATADKVVSESTVLSGSLSTPAFANGTIYWSGGYSGNAKAFTVNADGTLATTSQTDPSVNFGYLPGSISLSSNNGSAGIAWLYDRSANLLRAYDATTLATELWDSGQKAAGGDALGAVIKFAVPTVADGEVFAGTTNSLVIYGLTPPAATAPAAPSNLAAASLSTSSIRLTWKDNSAAPNAANGFLIEDSTDGVNFAQVTTAPGGSATVDVGGLAAGTNYSFRVRAYNGVGDSGYSNVATAATGGGTSLAPAAPSALGAAPASATSVTLTWTNNATNQTGFALDRATDAGFTLNLVTEALPATPSTDTDTLTGLSPGGTYYYRIRATNAAGASANSNTAVASIPVAPATPTNAQVTAVTTTSIGLTWIDNADRTATGYLIERRIGSGSFTNYAYLPAGNTDTPGQPYNWTDTGLTPGTAYEYHILAYNISGNNDFTGTNAETITAAPTGLTATASAGQVSLGWTAPAGATSYNIYRGTSSGHETLLTSGATTTAYLDATPAAGTTYDYTVTAVNANSTHVPPLADESAASNEASATPTAAGAPAINFPAGFATGTQGVLTFNGGASVVSGGLQLTDGGGYEARSVFSTAPVGVGAFTTTFHFQLSAGASTADGFAFVVQGMGNTAVGPLGGGLGYGTDGANGGTVIGKSLAIKFDLYSNAGEGVDSTGVYTNGASPTTAGSIDLTGTIDLHSGDPMSATVAYDGTNLVETIVDATTHATFTHTYAGYNIPALVGGNLGYVGFTAGTGGQVATQTIQSWTYATPASAPTVADAGFESVSVGSGSRGYAYGPAGSAWAFGGSPGSGSGLSGNNSAFTAGNPAAPQGAQVAFLQAAGAFSQAVAGWAAGSYTVSFLAAQRGNYGGQSENFEVTVDGAVVGTFRPTGTAYQPYTTPSFVVGAGSHTVAFVGLDSAGGDNTAFIDSVSVSVAAATAAVALGDAGFESVPLGPAGYAYGPAGSAWAFGGSPGSGSGLSGNNSAFTAGNPAAPQGAQVAFLQAAGSFSQSVSGFSAGNYTIAFLAAQRENYQASSEDFEVTVDGVVVGRLRPAGTTYQSYLTASFAVGAGSHTVAFVGLDSAGGDNTAFIDSVAIASA